MKKKDIAFISDGLRLSGQLYFPDRKPLYPAVCICHGIPNDSAAAITPVKDRSYTATAEMICNEGFAVMIFNFRGTGSSEGNFDMLGWTTDLKAAIRYLWAQDEIRRTTVALLGFSGGAAASICVAAEDKRVSAVAACASPAEFESFFMKHDGPDPVIKHYREVGIIRDDDFPPSPQEWLDNFSQVRPVDCVAGISPAPLLIVHGTADDMVDVSHAHSIYEKAGDPKKLAIVDGVGHGIRHDEGAMKIVVDWLKSVWS